MKTSRRAGIVLPLVSLVSVFALAAQAEPPTPKGGAKPAVHGAAPGAGHPAAAHPGPAAIHQGAAPGRG